MTAMKASASRTPRLRIREPSCGGARGGCCFGRSFVAVAQLVAHAVDGLHVARLARIRLQLLTQVFHMAVHRPLVALVGHALQAVEELQAGPYAARALGQSLEQRKLAGSERDALAAPAHR